MAQGQGRKLRSIAVLKSDLIVDTPAPILDLKAAGEEQAAEANRSRTSLGSISLVALCTLIAAAAQILMRYGAQFLDEPGLAAILTNWPLMAGYACLALNTGLLVLALRHGHLSVLYPIIALSYVWVTILSPVFFGDVINVYKVIGVALIVLGVSFIGIGSR